MMNSIYNITICTFALLLLLAFTAQARQFVEQRETEEMLNSTVLLGENIGDDGEDSFPTFWIRTEVSTLRWNQNCISTQFCAEPKFVLSNQIPKYNERLAREWPLKEMLVSASSRVQFYTVWHRRRPSDVSIQASVLGTDPKFKFSRLCDETPAVFLFHQTTSAADGKDLFGNDGTIVAEMHGLCFNMTLNVQLFRAQCPWCKSVEKGSVAKYDNGNGEEAQMQSQTEFLQDRAQLFILLLAVGTVVNCFAWFGLLFLFICIRQRYRITKRDIPNENSAISSSYNENTPPRVTIPNLSSYKFPFEACENAEQFRQVFSQFGSPPLPVIQEEFYEVIKDEASPEKPVMIPGEFECKKQQIGTSLWKPSVLLPNDGIHCSCGVSSFSPVTKFSHHSAGSPISSVSGSSISTESTNGSFEEGGNGFGMARQSL